MRFLDTLFYPGEFTSFTSSVKGNNIRCVDTDPQRSNFFCINPLDPSVNARSDSNVTAFRNFLIEMDKGTLSAQFAQVQQIGLPFSTCVYSGNKSLHFIVCLKEGLADKAEYKAYAKAIVNKVTGADPSVTNPSRLSRFPGMVRDNGKIQKEIDNNGEKISRAKLDAWLGPIQTSAIEPDSEDDGWVEVSGGIYSHTNQFLIHGAEEGEFNTSLFRCVSNLRDVGFSELAIKMMIEGMTLRKYRNPLDQRDLSTIASAFNSRT